MPSLEHGFPLPTRELSGALEQPPVEAASPPLGNQFLFTEKLKGQFLHLSLLFAQKHLWYSIASALSLPLIYHTQNIIGDLPERKFHTSQFFASKCISACIL